VLTSPAGPLASEPAAGQDTAPFPDFRFAPNIGQHAGIYETENRALHAAGHVLEAMHGLGSWTGRSIVDLGCGTGFWLPVYAARASRVLGVEPDPALRARAVRRVADGARESGTGRGPVVDVLAGSAEHMPLAAHTIDVVHARFAYFFPPGTDAGLAEVLRVLKPGGRLVVVDNDYRWGEFAGLLAASAVRPPGQTAASTDRWWAERGATRHEVRSELRFGSREDLAAVLHIEFPAGVADAWLSRHPAATGLTYGYVLFAVTG
jgi:SAM-dependent methyltransferase